MLESPTESLKQRSEGCILVYGPAYSGKSRFATEILDPDRSALFVGTAAPQDDFLTEIVEKQRSLRPPAWTTVEERLAVAETLRDHITGFDQVIIDSLNLWVANLILEDFKKCSRSQLAERVFHNFELLSALALQPGRKVVFVTSEVSAGTSPSSALAQDFRYLISKLNNALAASVDTVVEVKLGIGRIMVDRQREAGK